MDSRNGYRSILREIEALEARLKISRPFAPLHPQPQATATSVLEPSRPKPQPEFNPPKPSMLTKLHSNSTPSPPIPTSRPPQEAPFIPWNVKKFKDVYVSRKNRPIFLRHEHAEILDEVRRSFNQRRLYPGQEPITTTDLVAVCLDAILSHPDIPFDAARDREALPQLICDHIHRFALSRTARPNGQP